MDVKYPAISLCMIAKNEEQFIAQCIESVKTIVSEIILVDTGSTDNTCNIAAAYGAKVLHRPWDDDFAAPRNLSLEHATGEWILVLDADEMIAQRDLEKLRKLTLNRNYCYLMPQRHYTNDYRLSDFTPVTGEYPEWEKHYGGYFESSLVRLFPNREGINYQGRVHELVEHSVRQIGRHTMVNCGIRIHHYGHTEEVKKKKNKGTLYTPLGQAKLSDEPTNWKAYFELGVEHNNNGRKTESAEAFMKSAAMNPDYEQTWVNLGYVLCENGNYREAIESLQNAIRVNPNSSEAYCNIGVVYLRVQQFPAAEKYFQKAISIDPKYVNAYCNLGKALAYQNRLSEAVLFYRRALELLPQCTSAKLDLGMIYYSVREYEFAEKYMSAALKEAPHMNALNYQLGQIYKETNRAADAVRALTRFCEGSRQEGGRQESLEVQSFMESVRIECAMLARQAESTAA